MKKLALIVLVSNLTILGIAFFGSPFEAFATDNRGKQSTIYECTEMNSGSSSPSTYTRMVCYDSGPYNPCINWNCTLTWNNSGF